MTTSDAIRDIEVRLRGAKISVAAVCREAGIDRGTWQDWKRGEKRPRQDTWQRVSAVLEARLGERFLLPAAAAAEAA
jgi:hypothetical protein